MTVKDQIISLAPGRICLFGDHQDYLGLPIIACAIDRNIQLTAIPNGDKIFNIYLPDISSKRVINIQNQSEYIDADDHLRTALQVLKRYGCHPTMGYDITIQGNLPINAGLSSSSALLISWIQFLLEAFGPEDRITPDYIAQKAYEIEVLEHGSPGGKMDQFSISLGNIIYLETGEKTTFQVFNKPLPGLIIGESGIPKDTIGLLADIRQKATDSIHIVQESIKGFKIEEAKRNILNKYLTIVPNNLKPYLEAAIVNHDITQRALKEFKKVNVDLEKIGTLMTEHHDVLKNLLGITVPKIDRMIEGALKTGAFGAKIVGSGGGGSIVAMAPAGKEHAIIDGIINAGGKAAFLVSVDPGARLIKNYL